MVRDTDNTKTVPKEIQVKCGPHGVILSVLLSIFAMCGDFFTNFFLCLLSFMLYPFLTSGTQPCPLSCVQRVLNTAFLTTPLRGSTPFARGAAPSVTRVGGPQPRREQEEALKKEGDDMRRYSNDQT